jgi:GNAT superfamily N-acetyltransferase
VSEPGELRYSEAARSYLSTAALFLAVLAGFAVDLVFAGGTSHILGWLIVAFVLVGTDALGVYAARTMRSLTLTDTELRVGEDVVPVENILAAALDPDPLAEPRKVLGRRYTDTIPRGAQAVGLELADGRSVIVATRKPTVLLELLGAEPAAGLVVRVAEPDDLLLVPDIDYRAESLYRVAGLALPDVDQTRDVLDAAKITLVIGHPAFGFAQVDECDGLAQLRELSVLPGQMRQGHGTALLEAACAWAAEQGYPAITLTTFADVSWNAPYYRRRGFVDLDVLTPGLAAEREQEKAIGLDAVGPRIAMRREL